MNTVLAGDVLTVLRITRSFDAPEAAGKPLPARVQVGWTIRLRHWAAAAKNCEQPMQPTNERAKHMRSPFSENVITFGLGSRSGHSISIAREARGAVNQKGGLRRLSENVGRLCLNWQPGPTQWRFLRVLENWEVSDIAPIRAVTANSQFTKRERCS